MATPDTASPVTPSAQTGASAPDVPACVLSVNANDPCGASGVAADILSMSCVGVHVLPVVSGSYHRDTLEILGFFPLDEDAVADQTRTALQDMPVQVMKVGFAGSAPAVAALAELASDYADVPLLAYMPDLSWWDEVQQEVYQQAFAELLLPQTSVLAGNHNTLWRWLLPDWDGAGSPGPRDIARAASAFGVPFVVVTGILQAGQRLENAVATPNTVLATRSCEWLDAGFIGAGDTLSATIAALLATGCDLQTAFGQAMQYLDESLVAGFRPGMGQAIPDRLFWAEPDDDPSDSGPDDDEPSDFDASLAGLHETRH